MAEPADVPARLLEIVAGLARELQPERPGAAVHLDADLDRDLGFDSLSRVELLLRIEHGLEVRLPEQTFATAQTPRDLLAAVEQARSRGARPPSAVPGQPATAPVSPPEAAVLPAALGTLHEVLAWRATHQPTRPHVVLYDGATDAPEILTFAALEAGARSRAAGLAQRGLEPGDAVALMLPTGRAYLESFFGVLLAGGVPVPVYPPWRPSQLEDHLRRHVKILDNARVRALVAMPEAKPLARLLRDHVETLRTVAAPDDLPAADGSFRPAAAHPEQIALLQYTSGSTGQPKGVILSHADLLANIRAMGERVRADAGDVFVSWLPLYHDMGLIGAWLGSLCYAMTAVLMPPTAFLARPARWLRTIHEHRGTLSAAPNFAYQLCADKITDADLEGLDLGCWRLAVNGAEPVSPHTIERFTERFQRYGFDSRAMTPVYGLAECAVGLTFPPLGRGPRTDRIRRAALEREGRALPAPAGDTDVVEFVACGHPLSGYEVRIVDPAGRELGERQEGRLEFRGPSATRGYIGNPRATAALFHDGWLDSGDLAYVGEGDVFITSRVKDLIIRAGRNIYPYELEEAVGELPAVRKGCVAVFGSTDRRSGAERLIVVAETRLTDDAEREELTQRIGGLASDLLRSPPDHVLLVPPHTLLKTSSGKIRRAACRELYEQGRLGQPAPAVPWQIARVWLAGLGPRLRRRGHALRDVGYAAVVHAAFAILLPPTLLAVALLPRPTSRWRAVSRLARTLLGWSRIPLRVEGEHRLTAGGQRVVVANHASYADGLILLATLPRPVAFVAKAELQSRPLARWFLRRLGARFVERFDPRQGSADLRNLVDDARRGVTLLFFPEGTFTRAPGLRPFHMGAFLTAAESGAPVIPIALRGTRSLLRSDHWFPRRGPVTVIVGEALHPAGGDWHAALELRDRARQWILGTLAEPDLAGERPAGPPG